MERTASLCDFWDAENLVETVAHALEQAPSLAFMREQARQTVLTRYDGRVLLPACSRCWAIWSRNAEGH